MPSPVFAPPTDMSTMWSIWRGGRVKRREMRDTYAERGGSKQDSAFGPVQYAANALAESVRYIAAVGAADNMALNPVPRRGQNGRLGGGTAL